MTTVLWRGLLLGQGSPYKIQKVSGWESRPATRRRDEGRASAHGVHAEPMYADERIVTIEGRVVDRAAAGRLVEALEAVTPMSDAVEDLAVTMYGRTLTAGARCIDRDLPQDLTYNGGVTDWMLQWSCPDPLRYSTASTASTALPNPGGGLLYPLMGTATNRLDYGAAGTTGRLVVANPGTAPAPLLLAVLGALPQGWQVSAAGRALTYPVAVPSGQTLTVNTAAGTVLAEGTASRRGNLTQADWLTVPAADRVTGLPGQLELQFASLGGARDPAAQLSATVRGAYW